MLTLLPLRIAAHQARLPLIACQLAASSQLALLQIHGKQPLCNLLFELACIFGILLFSFHFFFSIIQNIIISTLFQF